MLPQPFHERDGQIAVDLPGAHAIFTNRAWGDVRETAGAVGERLSVHPVMVRQVHGAAVHLDGEDPHNAASDPSDPSDPGRASEPREADAVIVTTHGRAATVITADCLPIVVAVPATRTSPAVVAAIHAGWRGLAAGVIAEASARLRALAPDGVPLTAAIGPGAGRCCYEVSDDLRARFATQTGSESAGQARNLDLKAIATAQLTEAGVDTVHDCGICTICDREHDHYSYRRDGAETGRQAVFAWLS